MSQAFHHAAIQANATREAAAAQLRYQARVRRETAEELKKQIEAFSSFDESSLVGFNDKRLAQFQADHLPESPQHALALHEWNRRLVARQVKATRFSAVVGLVGVVIGSFLGWVLASYSFKQSHQQFKDYISQPQVEHKAGQQAGDDLHGNDPDKVPVKPEVEPLN
jgi:ABC-type dipeptide/oligopeptide/nickel transport system permease subunit